MRDYTAKEVAQLREEWAEEFGAQDPEDLLCNEEDTPEPVTIVGPMGYCDIFYDGTVVTHGRAVNLFD